MFKNGHEPIKILEYNYIDDGIYIGTNKCCQKHFNEKLNFIEVDISLEAERVDQPFGIVFFIWLPVKNDYAPTPDQLEFGVLALEKFIAMKKKIYVHCQNGHSRAPTLVIAYFIKQGKTAKEALAFVKSKRPSMHLNELQKKALMKYQRYLR